MPTINCHKCGKWFSNFMQNRVDLENYKKPRTRMTKIGAEQDGLGAFRCPRCGEWNHVYKDQEVPKDAINPRELLK